MSRVSVKITGLASIRNQIRSFASEVILPSILRDAFDNIKLDIPNLFIQIMEETPMWQNLENSSGGIQYDLSAHLGVTSEELFELKEDIRQVILQTIRISVTKGRGVLGRFAPIQSSNSVTFTISFPDLIQRFQELPSAKYVSTNGFTIPWVNWLFNGAAINGYSIIYNQELDKTEFGSASKTGRGVMIPTNFRSWNTSQYAAFAETDFVTDTLTSPAWNDQLGNLLSQEIQRIANG